MGQYMDEWNKFKLYYNLQVNFYKMIYCWCSSSEKLSKMYKDNSNLCWKCEQ